MSIILDFSNYLNLKANFNSRVLVRAKMASIIVKIISNQFKTNLILPLFVSFLSTWAILRKMSIDGKPTHSANFTLLILALAIGGCLLAIIIVVSGAVTFYLQVSRY